VSGSRHGADARSADKVRVIRGVAVPLPDWPGAELGRHPVRIDVVECTVGDLGLSEGATLPQILGAAEAAGLRRVRTSFSGCS
jgi:hypothetical protein